MNYLFYVGIIIPTFITIVLFLIFIYCWFLQKARKEVITKTYDPHGKMRRLGLSMDPPPPPDYCRMDDSLLPDIGEDNIAYDVSRSPSSDQDGRGRPMYHTYHDSGISAGLSPSQESEPRPGFTYRTCPDSGISVFGAQSGGQCAGCCQAEEQPGRQPSQLLQQQQQQQMLHADQIQIHAHELEQRVYHHHQQAQHLPQVALHHNLVQASVHPTHGLCYGDDMAHSQSPQHYNSPPAYPGGLGMGLNVYSDKHNNLTGYILEPRNQSSSLARPQPKLNIYPGSTGHQLQAHTEQVCYHANNIMDQQHAAFPPAYERHGLDNAATPSDRVPLCLSRGITSPSSAGSFHSQPTLSPDSHTQNISPSSSSSEPLRHSYIDNALPDTRHSKANNAERPDSQDSQSSTSDSEDSGFRSSHCAAHHAARLSKQGNPLLKPLRRTKNNKSKTKPSRTASSNSDDSTGNGAAPLITLNPQNLQTHVDNSNVIQNIAMVELDLPHRQPRTLQQSTTVNTNGPLLADRLTKTNNGATQSGPALTFHDGSPIHVGSAGQHSPRHENWSPQSTNDQEGGFKQNIDLNDISTHLSWKYLQDLSSNNSPAVPNGNLVLQPCHGGLRPGQMHQLNPDQHTELFGYSVV